MVAIALMAALINLDFTIINIALATIATDMHASLNQIQWIVNIYLLFGAVFFILGGRFGDRFGKTKIYMLGLLIFVIASTIGGFAPNIETIIIGRALQGIGMAPILFVVCSCLSGAIFYWRSLYIYKIFGIFRRRPPALFY